jgi:hypothetical protein
METMYERIKRMTMDEMREFIYWVYLNGNEDGEVGCCDSSGYGSYFGGYMLTIDAVEVMPNDIVDDLWDNFNKVFGKNIN